MPRPLDPQTRKHLVDRFEAQLVKWAGGKRSDDVPRLIAMFQLDIGSIEQQHLLQAAEALRQATAGVHLRYQLQGHIETYFIKPGPALLLTKEQRNSALAKARDAARRRRPDARESVGKVIKVRAKDADRLRRLAAAAGVSTADVLTSMLDDLERRPTLASNQIPTAAAMRSSAAPKPTKAKRAPGRLLRPKASKIEKQRDGTLRDLFDD